MDVTQANALMNQGSELLLKGRFDDAVDSFDQVLRIDASKEPYLWQRGIALFFAGRHADGAKQFQKDLEVNGRDAEETIWRFMCAAAHASVDVARKEFVQPQKGDARVPMREILALFAGTGSEEAVVAAAETMSAGSNRENSLFYAHYYLGCYHEAERAQGKALEHIRTALKYRTQDYMGRIAKVHELYLARKLGHKRQSIPSLSLMPASQAQTILPDGYVFSKIIRGCWQLSKGHQLRAGDISTTDGLIEDFVRFHEKGITSSDCGDIYTGVEETLGKCIRAYRDAVELTGGEARMQVHTKIVPDLSMLDKVDLHYCRQTVLRSLNRLSVEHLDLVQLHWWDYSVKKYVETAKHLVTLRNEGLLRYIGVTNFDTPRLQELIDAGVPVVTNQVQFSLLDRRPLTAMVPLCAKTHVVLLAYGVLAGGFLTDKWLGQPEPLGSALSNRSLVKYKLVIDEAGGWAALQTLLQALRQVADRHTTTIAAVAVRWTLSQPHVGAVILGGRDSSQLDAILPSALQIKLIEDDTATIDAALAKLLPLRGDVYQLEREKEGPHAKIMRYELSRVNEVEHLKEAIYRYSDLMHRLHPERASENGLRTYDTFAPITSARDFERTALQLRRVLQELDGLQTVARLEKSQMADLAAIHCDAKLRLFRISELHEAQTDPFLYLSPGYRGIRYMATMLGRIIRAEHSLLMRMRKFVVGLKNGIANLEKPPAYLVKSAVSYIEGLTMFFESVRQKFQRDYEEHLLDETARQLAAAAEDAVAVLAQFSSDILAKAVKTYGIGRNAYEEMVRVHLQKGLTVEDLIVKAETMQKDARQELQAIVMANRASSPQTQAPPVSPPQSRASKGFSINLRRRSVAAASPPSDTGQSSPTNASSPSSSSPNLADSSTLTPPREHGRSFSFGNPTGRSFSFGRRRSSTTPLSEINHLGQLPSDADAEKLYKDVCMRTKNFLTSPNGVFSTLAKLASLIDEEAAILNNIATSLPDHLSASLLRAYPSGDIAVIAIHETLREFVQLAVRMNSGERLFAEQGLPTLLAEGCVLYLADVLIRENFFTDYEYQRQRTIHRRLVVATRAILEIKMHGGLMTPDEFRSELVTTCEVPERPANEFARQALREPTVAAAAVLGFQMLQEQERKFGSDPASVRRFLEYVFAGDGLCVEVTRL